MFNQSVCRVVNRLNDIKFKEDVMTTLVKSTPGFVNELPSFFDDFFTKDLFNTNKGNDSWGNTLPAVNVEETDTSYELEVAAPGMSKKDFHVEIDNNSLIISGEREMKNQEKDKNFTRREFSYQSFKRTFNLPENMIEGEKVNAKYENGILKISIPKTEEARIKPSRQIQIS